MKKTKLRYFYSLEYKKPGEFGSVFGLGWFSTKNNYLLKIDKALKTPGFVDRQCFNVYKVGVKIPADQEKSGSRLYTISHEYEIQRDGEYIDCYTYFDTLFTKKQAEEKVKYLRAYIDHAGENGVLVVCIGKEALKIALQLLGAYPSLVLRQGKHLMSCQLYRSRLVGAYVSRLGGNNAFKGAEQGADYGEIGLGAAHKKMNVRIGTAARRPYLFLGTARVYVVSVARQLFHICP